MSCEFAHLRSRSPAATAGSPGFTLIELVLVMGLLSSFLLMLVQLLGSGVDMYGKGQRGQDLADRADLAVRAVRESLGAMVGPISRPGAENEAARPDARLIVSWEPTGFSREPDAARSQIVRTTVALTEAEENALLRRALEEIVAEEFGSEGEAFEEELALRMAEAPRTGRADMLLLAWPVGSDGVFMELRRGRFTARDGMQLMDDFDFGGQGDDGLAAEVVPLITESIASGLLHFECALWSPRTSAWGKDPDGGGPEYAWDSARGGRLLFDESGDMLREEAFGLDLGPQSERDARDDVFPRWMRVTLVVARSAAEAPEAFLDDSVGASDRTLHLNRIDRIGDLRAVRFAKVGAEWVEFGGIEGTKIDSVRRGRRGTTAREHPRGTPVRIGKVVTFDLRIAHGRDADAAIR